MKIVLLRKSQRVVDVDALEYVQESMREMREAHNLSHTVNHTSRLYESAMRRAAEATRLLDNMRLYLCHVIDRN